MVDLYTIAKEQSEAHPVAHVFPARHIYIMTVPQPASDMLAESFLMPKAHIQKGKT